MQISLILTGDELLDGRVVNTNLSDISAMLHENSFAVMRAVTVGDSLDGMVQTIQEEMKRADVLIVSGGLGPTEDDRTAEAIAKAVEAPLTFNPNAFDEIQAFFINKGRDMAPTNKKQAYLPKGSQMISNSVGTAPGFYVETKNTTIFSVPGVPSEMRPMIQNTVIGYLNQKTPNQDFLLTHTFQCTGVPEAELAYKLEDLYPLPAGVEISFRVPFPIIVIRIKSVESKKPAFNKICEDVRQKIKAFIVAESENTLEENVVEAYAKKRKTIAIAESCTGGLIASKITRVPGASEVLKLGVVSYSNEAKQDILGVETSLIEAHGAVSEEVAKEMAEGARKKGNSDIALSVTGIAGPGGGTLEKPVGTVWIGVSTQRGVSAKKYLYHGDRKKVQNRAAIQGLLTLLVGLE